MTPSQIAEAARRRYNAIGDSFWSDDEMYQLIYDACLELAQETNCIERTFTTTTVSGTQEYDFPTNVLSIKRMTYDGAKLRPISMREDDALTGLNSSTTSTGTPQYYYIWNKTVSLRPVPDDAKTLKVYAYTFPSTISSTSTLEVPEEFHMKLINYILQQMTAKDQNYQAAQYYLALWEKDKRDVLAYVRRKRRADAFMMVQDEELLSDSYLGGI